MSAIFTLAFATADVPRSAVSLGIIWYLRVAADGSLHVERRTYACESEAMRAWADVPGSDRTPWRSSATVSHFTRQFADDYYAGELMQLLIDLRADVQSDMRKIDASAPFWSDGTLYQLADWYLRG